MFFTLSRGETFRRYSGAPLEATLRPRRACALPPPGGGGMPCPRRGDCRCPPTGAKGGKGTVWFPCPLLTPPHPPLRRDSLRSRGETGVRWLGSGRLSAYGTLYRPEFTLRKPPRITVRGQTVQGACTPLRKAPLRSRAYPWSTRRPCGPLAFRRATGGSRVPRRVWGVKRGKGTIGALSPLVSDARRRQCHAMSWRTSPAREGQSRLQRRTAVSARGKALGRVEPAIKLRCFNSWENLLVFL